MIATAAASLSAQSKQPAPPKNGIVNGRVVDTTNALIPGVTLILTNTETNAELKTLSSDIGKYKFDAQPGLYQLAAVLRGFETITIPNVRVTESQTLEFNIMLRLGGSGHVILIGQ